MPVIEKPKGSHPPFGGHCQVMIGSPLVAQLIESKRSKVASNNAPDDGSTPASIDDKSNEHWRTQR